LQADGGGDHGAVRIGAGSAGSLKEIEFFKLILRAGVGSGDFPEMRLRA
jgi:hypothetical protein